MAEVIDLIRNVLTDAIGEAISRKLIAIEEVPPVDVSRTKDPSHGDYSTNWPLVAAPAAGRTPRELAEMVVDRIDGKPAFSSVEVAGPGFINFTLSEPFLLDCLRRIEAHGLTYASPNLGGGARVQIEFVSANPTGPLHLGHGRGAVLGDVLTNLMRRTGFEVSREYYVNDAGKQIDLLAASTWARYRQHLGQQVPFPEEGYQGEYILEIARELGQHYGRELLELPEEEALALARKYSMGVILDQIQRSLRTFGVSFDRWFREGSLYQQGKVTEEVLAGLRSQQLLYEEDGALWFRATSFGDEKDRVVRRSNGQFTYFASDILYLEDKFRRGFQRLICIWGSDHHGYVPRMQGVVRALGHPAESFQVLLVQFVTLLREGKKVSMSTRAGEFIPLDEVLQEVGPDAARFWFLTRKSDSHLEFDLELAKRQSRENPVYYVQYAHARICSIEKKAQERGLMGPPGQIPDQTPDLALLRMPEELTLIKHLAAFPETIEECVRSLEAHRLTYYLQELASHFHGYYYLGDREKAFRVLSEDTSLAAARLYLAFQVRTVLRIGLQILGVSAPEAM